jgi:hypothetical protein
MSSSFYLFLSQEQVFLFLGTNILWLVILHLVVSLALAKAKTVSLVLRVEVQLD